MSIKTIDDVNFRRIGENLKRIRNAKGETQQDVADAIGMQSYGNYERGTEKISLCEWKQKNDLGLLFIRSPPCIACQKTDKSCTGKRQAI